MSRLFLKLFLWLWVAMSAVGGALAAVYAHWSGAALPEAAELQAHAEELEELAAEARDREARAYLRGLQRGEAPRLRIVPQAPGLSPQGQRRGLHPLQEALEEVDLDGAASGWVEGHPYRAVSLELGDGRERHLVAVGSPAGLADLPPGVAAGLALAITAALAALLAARLSQRVRRIRRASQRLAQGDLSARAGITSGGGDELQALAGDFNRMADQLAYLIESRGHLLRDLSHELRSPLARLQTALELARQQNGERQAGHLARMEHELEHLDRLIGQILSLARLEAGAAQITPEPIDLPGLVESIARDARYELRGDPDEGGEGRSVAVVLGPEATVQADRYLLRAAIENAVRNALQHTPEGSAVTVTWEVGGEGVEIRVRDEGPGVPEEELQRIFEPFRRLASGRRSGHGLGLAITRHAAETLGGAVHARNRAPHGLEVVLHLPSRPGRREVPDTLRT
ncbi:HAMP domain-containing sensor histidine kinase [Halorhodospira halophila]|uniref:HAMP domain-containing sensor histidine kinase n=1 Tax=Halorhodospira halophila TaxID=1053 RepID=UPI001911379B|nr:HAMP domain-containing sensor histidine kinase [Halorhodospira halophila]MBK5937656.1 hypothetical protein [Halorhodospira halophila]